MLRTGHVLARRYRLLKHVGGGGMGDVWCGQDTVLDRRVAVKVLRPVPQDQARFLDRFRREARAIAALESPGVVSIYDYGEIALAGGGELAFLVMPFVDGVSLTRLLESRGRLTVPKTLRIVSQVAEALHCVHRIGIVHRDVKPGNILLRPNGRAVLVDFGIARTGDEHSMTSSGMVLGTISYMSPEQASGEKIGPLTDVFSLGVVAYQCLMGRLPYRADTPLAMIAARLRKEPDPLPSDVPAPVADLVLRAMATEPRDRWPGADALAAQCRHLLREPVPVGAARPARGTAPVPVRPATPGAAPAAPAGTRENGAGAGPRPPRRRPRPGPAPLATPPPVLYRRGRSLAVAGFIVMTVSAVALIQPWGTDDFTRAVDGEARPIDDSGSSTGAPSRHEDTDDSDYSDGQQLPSAADPAGGDSPPSTADDPGSTAPSIGQPTRTMSPIPGEEEVEVPDVLTRSESDARTILEKAEFEPKVIYRGTGGTGCGVVAQDPAAGSTADARSVVTITVERAEQCLT